MKNKIRTLVIASICMAATLSSVPSSVNPFSTTTVHLLDKIKHINKITMLIMFASTISYGIRDIKTYKLQKLSKIKDNK